MSARQPFQVPLSKSSSRAFRPSLFSVSCLFLYPSIHLRNIPSLVLNVLSISVSLIQYE